MTPDLFLGVFPAWVGDLLSILGLPAILLVAVTFLLNKKQANRKLNVDEGTLKRSEFDSFTEAQNKALEGARKEAQDAKDESDANADRLDVMDDLYDGMRDIVFRLRTLFQKVVKNTGYTMTKEDLAEFEATKPLPRPPRKR